MHVCSQQKKYNISYLKLLPPACQTYFVQKPHLLPGITNFHYYCYKDIQKQRLQL